MKNISNTYYDVTINIRHDGQVLEEFAQKAEDTLNSLGISPSQAPETDADDATFYFSTKISDDDLVNTFYKAGFALQSYKHVEDTNDYSYGFWPNPENT